MNWWKTLLGKLRSKSNTSHTRFAQSGRTSPEIRDGYLDLLHNGIVRRAYGNHERLRGRHLQYQFFSSRDELTRFFAAIKTHACLTPPPLLVEVVCGQLNASHRVANHYKMPYAMLTPFFGDDIQDAEEWYSGRPMGAIHKANDIASVGMHADGSEEPNNLLEHIIAVYDWGVLVPEALRNDGAMLIKTLSDEPFEPDAISKKWLKLTS